MNLKDVIEDFLDKQRKENGEATARTYKRKIDSFYEYLTLELKADYANYMKILADLSLEDLLRSVEYYVQAGNIKSRSTVDIFYAVLGNFYKYLNDKYGLKNEYFQKIDKMNNLKIEFENKIRELGLKDSEQQIPIDNHMAKKVLRFCDDTIDSIQITEVLEKKRGIYSNYISAIIVKLVLLYGLKNDTIRSIKIEDYDEPLNSLIINNYRIKLPDKLAIQMKQYKKVRKMYLDQFNITSVKLFFDDVNIDKRLDNTKMFVVLNSTMGNTQAGSVAKYAIKQMLINGIPVHIVREFTGYKMDVINHCQDLIDEERGVILIKDKCRILDSAIRMSDLFDDM